MLNAPRNVVKHIYEGRVMDDKMLPDKVAGIAERAFFSKTNSVSKGRYSHIQEVRHTGRTVANVGYISVDPKTGEVVMKTVLPMENKRLK